MQHAPANPPIAASDAAPRDATANLLLAATRRFCDARPPSRGESDQYREAFYACIHRLDTATRQSVATLLSRTPYCPRPIALFLAMDVPAVAHSVLKHSSVLGERDLEQVVTKATPIHVRLLATRPNLTGSLVRRIAAFDDADIRAALEANATLRTILPKHLPIEAPTAGPLRQTVKASGPSVENRLRTALARTAPGRANISVHVAPAMEAEQFRTALEACAMRRDRKGMVGAMRARFDLTHATAIQALDDRTGDALQVLMKAEGFDAAAANRIVMLAIPAVGLSPAATQRALEIWERLQVESCRKALAAWPREERVGVSPSAHQPVHNRDEGVRRSDHHVITEATTERFERTG